QVPTIALEALYRRGCRHAMRSWEPAHSEAGRTAPAVRSVRSARWSRADGPMCAAAACYQNSHQKQTQDESHAAIVPRSCNAAVTVQRSVLSAADSDCFV